MTLKSLLVPLAGVSQDRRELDLALAAATPSGAHIQALFLRPERDSLLGTVAGLDPDAPQVRQMLDTAEQDVAAAAQRAHAIFVQWCQQKGVAERAAPGNGGAVTAAWTEAAGRADELIPRAGGGADLIVQSAPDATAETLDRTTLEAVLFASGRPVLVVPAQHPAELHTGAIIAWNGSAEANRAVAAALPLLARCKRVGVFCAAEPGRDAPDLAVVVDFLAQHGIPAAPVAASGRGTVAEQLFEAARAAGASLLVLGAYSHGRLRQRVFGGLTTDVLERTPVPALLMH